MTYYQTNHNPWVMAGVRVLLRNATARKGILLPRDLHLDSLVEAAQLAEADILTESDRWCMRAEAIPGISDGFRELMILQAQVLLEVYRAAGGKTNEV